jgi:hypothetical protein
MVADDDRPAGFSLRRWSQRKLEATRASDPLPGAPPPQLAAPPAVAPATTAPAAAANADGAAAAPELPPVESLTFDSDFTAFLQPKVDEALRRQALRTLFRDPRFNVMDGLDVYIDDYSKTEPIPAAMLAGLKQAQNILQWAREDTEERRRKEEAGAGTAPLETDPEQAALEPPEARTDPGHRPEVKATEPARASATDAGATTRS